MTSNENSKKTETIPEEIIKHSTKSLGVLPSIIETDYYTVDALELVISKNKIIWSDKYYNGTITIYNSGLIGFKESDILFYFIKRDNENLYKFYSLSKEESTDSVIFYLNKLKKFKTIT